MCLQSGDGSVRITRPTVTFNSPVRMSYDPASRPGKETSEYNSPEAAFSSTYLFPAAVVEPPKCFVPTLEKVPNRKYILGGKLLGRFFMRSAKEATTIATIYPEIYAHENMTQCSGLAEITKIADPNYTREFRLTEINLKDAKHVLPTLIDNILAGEDLARTTADKIRV